MKKKFHQSLKSGYGMTLVEVAVSVGILSAAMLASVQLRQSSYKLAKSSSQNSQITEEHRLIASLISTIPKIQANSLFGNFNSGVHPRFTASVDVKTGGVISTENTAVAVDADLWEDAATAFWNFVGSSETENPTETLSLEKFNTDVVPALNAAGCVSCHSGANYFFDQTKKWGLGSSLGRKLLTRSISFPGTLKDQDLRHDVVFVPNAYDLLTGEPSPQPNQQCRALVDSGVRKVNNSSCRTNCPGPVGQFSCNRCPSKCCDASGKNCQCCGMVATYTCMTTTVSQANATCAAPLVVSGYNPFTQVEAPLANSCGGAGIKTFWECKKSGPAVTVFIKKWSLSYTVTTTWINETDNLPRSIVTRGELK